MRMLRVSGEEYQWPRNASVALEKVGRVYSGRWDECLSCDFG